VQAEDGIRDATVTGVQTCALPICIAGEELDVEGLKARRPCKLHAPAAFGQVRARLGEDRTPLVEAPEHRERAASVRTEPVVALRSEERRVGKERRTRARREATK